MKEVIREYLKTNLGIDDEETFVSLYQDYCRTLDESIAKIAKNLADGDFLNLRASAHAIKGCSANIGLEELRKICADLQISAEHKDKTESERLFAEIKSYRPRFD